MKLDLSHLSDWSDEDVLGALDDLDEGVLNDRQVDLVDSWLRWLDEHDSLTPRQRQVAEEILREAVDG